MVRRGPRAIEQAFDLHTRPAEHGKCDICVLSLPLQTLMWVLAGSPRNAGRSKIGRLNKPNRVADKRHRVAR
jgi:hypothetical protein